MDNQNEELCDETPVKTYRFKISNNDLYKEMVLFADINRFLNKTDLKEAYEKWIETPDINIMVRGEEKMLKLNHYDLGKNNITQKIFKSIKYYHIKKMTFKPPCDAQKDNKQKEKRKKEIVFSKELLESVKEILQNSKDLKPSEYYKKFVDENEEMIEREKGRLEEPDTLFETKLKKMMKNQYYMMFQKGK
tara:strand:+ start:117 stop:689 length:573 start_codon:yes stop_codon:yes gene_type:complete